MDAAWKFRNAYNEARKIKDAQDEFCRHAKAGRWKLLEEDATGHGRRSGKKKLPLFPEDLQWESLVDVLRGRVKVCFAGCFLLVCLALSSCLCIVMRSVSTLSNCLSFE